MTGPLDQIRNRASNNPAEPIEAQLRTTYLDLINQQLPAKAQQEPMSVRRNHCFARIVLDNLCGGCWYDYFSRRQPAYKQLNREQLLRAIAIAKSMLHQPGLSYGLNRNSLRWRGKEPM